MTPTVAVVGGGITGLAAAFELTRHEPAVRTVVLEATDRVGGMVDGGPVGPVEVDAAADGFLVRQPEMAELCRQLGLGDELVEPRTSRAYIWTDGALRPIPGPSVLGVPLDRDALAESGIVSDRGLAEYDARTAIDHPPLTGDASVGRVVRERVGDEVFERLVDPLISGINAGRADEISARSSAAALAEAAEQGGDFLAALRSRAAVNRGQPVFNGLRGGTHRATAELRSRLADRIVTGSPVRALDADDGRWRVEADGCSLSADAVVVATPARVTSRLLEPHVPHAADVLGGIESAGVALATFVFRADAVGRDLDGSGFLVPRGENLLMTACSWTSAKWAHHDDGIHAVLRVSAGRSDDRRWQSLGDELVPRLADELEHTMGVVGAPVATRVGRWAEALPQYRPGHLDRVADVEASLARMAPPIVAAGAAFRGLGLPACVAQGRQAARTVVAALAGG